MKVDKDTLTKIAHLARLEIDPGQEDKIINDLGEILTWVEKLSELDTENVQPLTNMSQEVNRFRDDKVGDHLPHDKGLKNGPDTDEDFFKVPKVLG
ncbi:MAG: Asp-tRNA(Asn)/Glu-tRNA(Gln) amidotransferase subunit GatC [Cyclobacteriaceae bacterium]|nr:Asp-tRNA(Asn)/Glu-tRNA(Gln) amidotransferase subunit GatC [Cyclobacteriaceae bacterium HetDA_MAG_MS6]